MADLKNRFSWSFSAAKDFDVCPRKRYWAKYAAWGGWSKDAAQVTRLAYRLSKMESRFTLMGQVIERAVRSMLQRHQEGSVLEPAQAYEDVVRPLLNTAWQESRRGAWKDDFRKHTCLHEHYYPQFVRGTEKELIEGIRERVQRCLTNFHEQVLPRLAHVRPENEVALDTPELNRKVEGFEWHGIQVYAVPDYVYQLDDTWHIHDWKTGRPDPSHRDQLEVYALWAHVKHKVPVERLNIYLEYLNDGYVVSEPITQESLDHIGEKIVSTATDMADYLEDGDVQRNQPRPKEEWDLAPDISECQRCAFYELCQPELENI